MIHDTLQAYNMELPLVSVVIPVYNTQDYLPICLRSVLKQTYRNFEIICVDDGSTDLSAQIIKEMMISEPRIRLIQIENHGQGFARNLARKEACGKYILFLDADDYIEDTTLDLAVTRAELDGSDFVVFDWYYFQPVGLEPKYSHHDSFFRKKMLDGDECLQLLRINPIFSVNKLYRREFLDRNSIFYGEGYIYEDNPFWVQVVLSAKRVSLIHSPLYRVTISSSSSTKTKQDTEFHYKSYVRACTAAFEQIKRSTRLSEEDTYCISLYFFSRFLDYYMIRTPSRYRGSFSREFADIIGGIQIKDFKKSPFLSFAIKHKVFSQKKYALFRALLFYYHKLRPYYKKARSKLAKLYHAGKAVMKRAVRKLFRNEDASAALKKEYDANLILPLYQDVILFMGFDGRYTGNSRYLFEEMLETVPTGLKLFFVTNDHRVPFQYRIEPNSERCERFVARSKVIIFESWTPARYRKRPGTVWIQLWHGTPLKKLLFDSNEETVFRGNPYQKTGKYADILKWDYLLADNKAVSSYFQTAFLLDPRRILPFGYPRVRYLLNNHQNEALKSLIREKNGISKEKKIVLFLPTWRDCNYRAAQGALDVSYLPDLNELQKRLGETYEIVYKDHPFISDMDKVNFTNHADAETQELLLIADVLLTDYSSAMFDALAIDVPIVLYCRDFEKNEELRGVYPSIWNDMAAFRCDFEEDLPEAIKRAKTDPHYLMVKQKYAFDEKNSRDLGQFIYSLF